MACHEKGRDPDTKILSDDPVAASTHAHEAHFVRLTTGSQEQAVLRAPPSLHDNSGYRVDPDIADRPHRARQRSRALRRLRVAGYVI